MISIHAPRVGSDLLRYQLYAISTISIHAPRVGSDCNVGPELHRYSNFNPRSPCGERPDLRYKPNRISGISIHAPRVGSDRRFMKSWKSRLRFQSTLPVWGATPICGFDVEVLVISIHAPRVGSDARTDFYLVHNQHFNPRSPCGERRCPRPAQPAGQEFQSTLPVWGATTPLAVMVTATNISIHAPRVGSDPKGRLPGCY